MSETSSGDKGAVLLDGQQFRDILTGMVLRELSTRNYKKLEVVEPDNGLVAVRRAYEPKGLHEIGCNSLDDFRDRWARFCGVWENAQIPMVPSVAYDTSRIDGFGPVTILSDYVPESGDALDAPTSDKQAFAVSLGRIVSGDDFPGYESTNSSGLFKYVPGSGIVVMDVDPYMLPKLEKDSEYEKVLFYGRQAELMQLFSDALWRISISEEKRDVFNAFTKGLESLFADGIPQNLIKPLGILRLRAGGIDGKF